ncbi:hypothetical protein Tco_0670018 [Tanacetum coccineum]
METKDTLSSYSDLDEQELQQLQMQANILKENSMNNFNALKTTTQCLERQTFTNCPLFQQAFSSLFSNDVKTFKFELSHNMDNLKKQLKNETLHEKDSKCDLSVIKVQFDKFLHSEELKPSNYDGRHVRENLKDYTQMEAQTFKETIIQNMDSIEQCIVERARHEQEIQNSSGIVSDKGNDHSLEIQSNTPRDKSSRSRNECNDKSTSRNDTDIKPSYDIKPIAKVPYIAEYNVFAVETRHSEQPKNMNDTSLMEKVDSNTTPDSSDKCNNEFKDDQNADDHEDERVVLADLIANLKCDIYENKKIQKQLRNGNTTLTHELKECKSTLEETNRTLRESNRTRDRYLVSFHDKEVELVKYKTFKDRIIENDTLERKLKETEAVLAQKEHDIKEGLKLKAYEISVVKEKHNELVKQSLLTKSSYEGLVKEKNKVIKDLKLKEESDIDKLITMEKQLKFLNGIIYKRNQSIQTIHMLAPKGSTYNGRPTFANPMYLKKAQSEKPSYGVNAPGPSRNRPKHVSFQSQRESVGSNDMVQNYYLEEAKKKAQLHKDKALNTKPSVQQSARLPNTGNGNKPKHRNFNQQPRNWPPSMSSRVSNRTVNIAEPPRNQKPFLMSKYLACPTCKKCIYSANHDECILKYLSKVNSHIDAQKRNAQSHKTTKRYIPIEKKINSKKHDR